MVNENAIERTGRTVDDAVQSALRQLRLPRAQVEVEVLEEGRTGIFGIGHAESRVRVTPIGRATAEGTASPSLPRIDDYEDLTEVEPGQREESPRGRSKRSGRSDRRSSRRSGRGGRAAAAESASAAVDAPTESPAEPTAESPAEPTTESQLDVQPDHRSRSRTGTQPRGRSVGRREGDAGRGRERGGSRERRRDEPRERQAARPPLDPFELLADPDFEPNEDPVAFATEVLTDISHLLGFNIEVTARKPETPMDGLDHAEAVLDVGPVGDEDLGLLIGRHGAHVSALQYLVNVIVSRALEGNHPFTVDVGGYRRRREVALVAMAARAAEEVRELGEPVTLGAMPAAERRIIHLQLQDESDLTTESFGEGASRRVRILYRDA